MIAGKMNRSIKQKQQPKKKLTEKRLQKASRSKQSQLKAYFTEITDGALAQVPLREVHVMNTQSVFVQNSADCDDSTSASSLKTPSPVKGLKLLKLKKRPHSKSPDGHVTEAQPTKIPKHARSPESHLKVVQLSKALSMDEEKPRVAQRPSTLVGEATVTPGAPAPEDSELDSLLQLYQRHAVEAALQSGESGGQAVDRFSKLSPASPLKTSAGCNDREEEDGDSFLSCSIPNSTFPFECNKGESKIVENEEDGVCKGSLQPCASEGSIVGMPVMGEGVCEGATSGAAARTPRTCSTSAKKARKFAFSSGSEGAASRQKAKKCLMAVFPDSEPIPLQQQGVAEKGGSSQEQGHGVDGSQVEDEMGEEDWGASFLVDCEGLLDDVERESQLTGKEEMGSLLEPFNLFRVTGLEDMNGSDGSVEKVLHLSPARGGQEKLCHLCGPDWCYLEVAVGDEIRLVDPIVSCHGNYIVDSNHESYIIVNPDWLIGATTIADGVTCIRKAVLSELSKGGLQGGEGREVMVVGSLLHHVFESALRLAQEGKPVTRSRVKGIMTELVHKLSTLEDLYVLGISEEDVLSKLFELSGKVEEWVTRYFHREPVAGKGNIDFKRPSEGMNGEGAACLCVSEVCDIEENVWAPRLGLKGKIDATVEVKIHRPSLRANGLSGSPPLCDSGGVERYKVPFELKTGRMWSRMGTVEHRAQVILYALMMEERYKEEVPGGLLHYLRDGHMQGVPAFPQEKRALLMIRNRIAACLRNSQGATVLPDMLRDERVCKRCSQLPQCSVLHRCIDEGGRESSGLGELFDAATSHLGEKDVSFFQKWFNLVDVEVQCSVRRNPLSDIWGMDPDERCAEGLCVRSLQVGEHEVIGDGRVVQSFSLSPPHGHSGSVVRIPYCTMTAGERVVISKDDGHSWAVAVGYVKSSSPETISVMIDRSLPGGSSYRIDLQGSTPSTAMTVNLRTFLQDQGERGEQLRKLVIDLQEPQFSPNPVEWEKSLTAHLNSEQLMAVEKASATLNYLLIQGMPGTGKTTTLAALVHVLVRQGHTILLTSYTNAAVDNVLLKLGRCGVEYLRVHSASSSVHPEVLPHSTTVLARQCRSVSQLAKVYESRPVVGTTCLGINHPIFVRRRFDYCIVDEATQVTLPINLGPLQLADKFILVGDHFQLPPLVQSHEARRAGMEMSLFKLLCQAHPQALVALRRQFRMNQDIMLLSNSVIYDHKLQSGSDAVATATLHIPHWSSTIASEGEGTDGSSVEAMKTELPRWLLRAVDPSHPVVFINTDKLFAAESSSSGNDKWNDTEAGLVTHIVKEMLRLGVASSDIGVVTPYRRQLKTVREQLARETTMACAEVEVHTVDRYQGRDKPCIIVSFVRSNPDRQVGRLLEDQRRINVAVTRAKHKLIMIGSQTTLQSSPIISELLSIVTERGWDVSPTPT